MRKIVLKIHLIITRFFIRVGGQYLHEVIIMDVMDILDNLSGTSIEFLDKWSKPREIAFFKPFSSYSNAAFRAASIVTAPFALSLFSTLFIIITGIELLGTLYSAITMNFGAAGLSAVETFKGLATVLQILALAVVSPFINLVDTLGGGVKTLMQLSEKSQESNEENIISAAP